MEEAALLALAGIAVFFTLWLYFVLPADMAKDRNRSPGVWIILTLCFSPWILLILYAIGDAPSEETNV